MLKKILKITPIVLLVMLCISAYANGAAQAPVPATSSHQLRSPPLTKTLGPLPSLNKTYGGSLVDRFNDIISCASGGYALVGVTYSWGAGGGDVYLVRVDDNGNRLWNYTYGGADYDAGAAIVELSDGSFAITGRTFSYSANSDILLLRVDKDGNQIYSITFGEDTDDDEGYSLIVGSDDSLTIVGSTSSFGVDYTAAWLIHTGPCGHTRWNVTYDTPNYDDGHDVVECASGGYAITGTVYDGAYDDALLIRTNATGYHLWNHTYGGSLDDHTESLVECSGGGFALTGYTESYGVSDYTAWLVRVDASGNHLWNMTYESPDWTIAEEVIEYSDGGFALAGVQRMITVPASGARNRPPSPYDGLLLRTDASGNHLWNRTYGLTGYSEDRYEGLLECEDGAIITAGYTYQSGFDAWFVKTDYPLAWDPEPSDQTIALGTSLAYDLNVTSWFTLGSWTINDTTQFAISTACIVSDVVALSAGNYGLRVSITDTMGSEISAEFTITVEGPLISPIPLALIAGVAVIIIVLILLLLYYFVLRKRK